MSWFNRLNKKERTRGEIPSVSPNVIVDKLSLELLQAPHLLIAGQTGSGKSTMLDNIIYALSAYHPTNRYAYIIDLKRVSLLHWKQLPHIKRYAKDPNEALAVLMLVNEYMDNVYEYMSNKGLREWGGADVYLIVDECADLFDTVKGPYEYLKRIARLGRASKVHLILCTQSPNRRTIPADLTLNITHRLGLRCDSAIESRQIINCSGCEFLPMYGYGILKSPNNRSTIKYEITKTDDELIKQMVMYWKGE